MNARRVLSIACLGAALCACSDDPEDLPYIGTVDTGDTSPDATDAGSDVPEDAEADTAADVAEDAATDATEDAAADAADDASQDTAADTAPDAEPDAGSCEGDRFADFSTSIPLEIPIDGQPIMVGSWDRGEGVRYLIDTGAQINSYDVDLTDGEVTFFNVEQTDLVTTVVCDVPSKGRDLSEAEAYIGVNIDALLGQSAMRSLYTFIDYEGLQAWIFADPPAMNPPGMDEVEPVILPYELQNELPVATVTLTGGGTADLLTDTGSGVTILEQTPFDAMAAAWDGDLPRLDGYVWATNYGTDDAFITRVPTMDVGGYTVAGEWAVVIPDDNHIRALLTGSGIEVDGFLGYPVYRHFITEVQGPETRFRFWPYAEPPVHDDEWHRVGLEFVQRDGVTTVEMIFAPSAAAEADLAHGDILVAIDGDPVADVILDDIRRALHGTPGDERVLTIRDAETGDEADITLPVEDLLPAL